MIFSVDIKDINRDWQKRPRNQWHRKNPRLSFGKAAFWNLKIEFHSWTFSNNFSNQVKSLRKKNVEKRKTNFLLDNLQLMVATVQKMGSVNSSTTIGTRAVRVPPVAFVVDLPARIITWSSAKAASVPFRSNEKILSEFSISPRSSI